MLHFLEKLLRENEALGREEAPRGAYLLTGDRLSFERPYFARRKALTAAALLYLVRGGEDLLAQAERMLEQILAEPEWRHPAHGDTIDLFAAETGFMLAELQMLLPLDKTLKDRVRAALGERIAAPFLHEKFGWENAMGNWLAVCMGNVAGTLFYIAPDVLRAQMARIEGGLRRYLDGFPADGFCEEGLEYWNFGFGAFAYIADMVCPELLEIPKVREIARYPHRCFLRGNVTASFSDCPMDGRADRGLCGFLHARLGTPLLAEKETALRAENSAWLPLSRALKWADAVPARELEEGVYTGSAIFHMNGYSLAVKAGDNGEEHNHNDLGSFIFSTDAGQLIADLGQPLYDRDYFSEKRYENIAASSLGHSVPIVNGRGQRAGKDRCAQLSEDGLTVAFAGAYDGCEKLVRKFSFLRDGVRFFDEFSAHDRIRERFICIEKAACGHIVSDENFPAHITEFIRHMHDGTARPVYALDFEIPLGRTSASFTLKI